MAEKRKERCEHCRFWERVRSGELGGRERQAFMSSELEGSHPAAVMIGRCKRYPPTLLKGSDNDRPSTLLSATECPVTWDCDWCGEFQPIP